VCRRHGGFLQLHALAGAHTAPPFWRGAQQPLLHCEFDVHEIAQMAPSEVPVLTQ
jgi:hypothetical protein